MHTASDLASYLARQIPVCGSISRAQAERLLFRHGVHLTREQIVQAILIARDRGQVITEHGGMTLSRGK